MLCDIKERSGRFAGTRCMGSLGTPFLSLLCVDSLRGGPCPQFVPPRFPCASQRPVHYQPHSHRPHCHVCLSSTFLDYQRLYIGHCCQQSILINVRRAPFPFRNPFNVPPPSPWLGIPLCMCPNLVPAGLATLITLMLN